MPTCAHFVVSYRNSTSNHNCTRTPGTPLSVVSYRNSTSNHNWRPLSVNVEKLYLIEILHQTTTRNPNNICILKLYLIEILHQTTTLQLNVLLLLMLYLIEILHQTTTHHLGQPHDGQLYLIEILHQTTTMEGLTDPLRSCILSKFYIKPQLVLTNFVLLMVVSYRNSTSNHNLLDDNNRKPIVVSYRNSTSNHN